MKPLIVPIYQPHRPIFPYVWWTDVEVYPLICSREETIFMTLQLTEYGADREK